MTKRAASLKPKDKNGAMEIAPTTEKRTPATEADYLAAQLHEARSQILDLRTQLLNRANQALQKDQIILRLEGRQLEQENSKLRDTYGLAVGRTLSRDEETGKVFWIEQEPAADQTA